MSTQIIVGLKKGEKILKIVLEKRSTTGEEMGKKSVGLKRLPNSS